MMRRIYKKSIMSLSDAETREKEEQLGILFFVLPLPVLIFLTATHSVSA